MNLLRTCIVALAVVGALAPAAGADPWFAERAPEASPPAVIAGDRPGEVARIQAVPPISGDRPADRARTSLVVPVAVASGASFDWVAAGVGAAPRSRSSESSSAASRSPVAGAAWRGPRDAVARATAPMPGRCRIRGKGAEGRPSRGSPRSRLRYGSTAAFSRSRGGSRKSAGRPSSPTRWVTSSSHGYAPDARKASAARTCRGVWWKAPRSVSSS
jgi:hypothetical protein